MKLKVAEMNKVAKWAFEQIKGIDDSVIKVYYNRDDDGWGPSVVVITADAEEHEYTDLPFEMSEEEAETMADQILKHLQKTNWELYSTTLEKEIIRCDY